MLTFTQLVHELAQQEVSIPAAELQKLTSRFGTKVLQMGRLASDGSLRVPFDCVVDAARSLGTEELIHAAESINDGQLVTLLQSGETLILRVIEAREQKLRHLIRAFRQESNSDQAEHQWQQIERDLFGVEFHD